MTNTLSPLLEQLRADVARLEADQRTDAATRAALTHQLDTQRARLHEQAATAQVQLSPSAPGLASDRHALAQGRKVSPERSRRVGAETQWAVAGEAAAPVPDWLQDPPASAPPAPRIDPYPTQVALTPAAAPEAAPPVEASALGDSERGRADPQPTTRLADLPDWAMDDWDAPPTAESPVLRSAPASADGEPASAGLMQLFRWSLAEVYGEPADVAVH